MLGSQERLGDIWKRPEDLKMLRRLYMSKFHSTVNRRDFMKAIGLGAAGIGAAGAAAPVFHDIDEALSSPNAAQEKNAWWIKERPYLDSTTEIASKVVFMTMVSCRHQDNHSGRSKRQHIWKEAPPRRSVLMRARPITTCPV